MTVSLPPRRLIPRWRRTASTLALPEASFAAHGVIRKFELDEEIFQNAVSAWRESPTIGHLGDVLAYSFYPPFKDSVAAVAREVRATGVPITLAQKAIIDSVLGSDADVGMPHEDFGICDPFIRVEMANLRRVLNVNYSNPLALLDLAQFQLASGKHKDAERSLRTALSLSPHNRLVLRTLARFYVHVRQPDLAHHLLRTHIKTPGDPWLMASEIAVAEIANVSAHFASRGQRLIREKGAHYADLSELAGALGGIELSHGNMKHARDMFRVALRAPNDNVVAQAVTNQHLLAIDLTQPAQQRVALVAAEVQTLLAWESLNTEQSELQALTWHGEEPFSSRPLQFLTTLYAVQKKYSTGINLARRGLIADPGDPTLLSNLAYLLASSGDIPHAIKTLRRLKDVSSKNFDAIALATSGLIAMKMGDFDLGDELYHEAISRFQTRGEQKLETDCRAYYARSAAETLHPNRAVILKTAEDRYNKVKSADAAIIIRQLGATVAPLDSTESVRRLSQWVFDAKAATLTQRHTLTDAGAPLLLIKKD